MTDFRVIVVCDFEYETSGGEYNLVAGDLPKVLCMVAHVLNHDLQHVRTIRLWRGEFGSAPPFDIGPDALFVGYSAWAELTCFLSLGWKFPVHVFDQHTAYQAPTNILLPYDPDEKRKKQSKSLAAACRAYGIAGWENIDKGTIAKDIGEGRWRDHGQPAVFNYCEEDVRNSVLLLRRQLRGHNGFAPVNADLVMHWSNYSAKAIARIQARGMPIDMAAWNLVQENKAKVITALMRRFDPSHGNEGPIYNSAGEWNDIRFEQWLMRNGVAAWPRLQTGRLNLDGKAFKSMYHVPGVELLHALRDSLRVIVSANLPIGRDGRNRPSLFPFGTATGRNAHGKSLYNTHAGLRSFMVFPPDKLGVYLDWRTQEVAVVAALSEDPALIEAYLGGDVYHTLALDSGQTQDRDRVHWKQHNKPMRERMKRLQLAINYGMSVASLARGLGVHPLVASNIIEGHRRKYRQFWAWREARVQGAMLDRRIESVFGWPLHLSHSPNERTLFNFPAQSNGAEMLRIATVRLCEAGLVPCMLVHDGILFELDRAEQIGQALEIMRSAGRDVCRGLDVDADMDQKLVGGARYQDKRDVAIAMWRTIMDVLSSLGVRIAA